ncbi:14297_t:CDS:2 [Entrophospora sp. SA101]|nr:5234_t:CDS:2 [Entrophospora sp. SA101]CAJ0642989.1 14297_t:CDS:2 [Entrophospora sp. SA101]CAJ0824414.1 8052_t:CDS:2 [Entrophospora sp. SA101]CAJ0904439.1 19667_t:CDS:2 [Entrophospora sp. SA101]CAJ0908311.1 7691_t:CDS:2 [Entrophospora sp. SA101]
MAQNYNECRQFLEETSSIENSINTIQRNVERIQVIQTRILVSTSAQMEDDGVQEREELTLNTKKNLFETKDWIKKIEYENIKLPINDPNNSIRKQRLEFLKAKFTNALENFHSVEDTYMRQRKERMTRQYRVVNPEASQDEIDNYLSNPSCQPLCLIRTSEARAVFTEVQKRHSDIKQIEKTIEELAILFREVQLQVEEQDSVILNVEVPVEESLANTKQSEIYIEKAHENAVQARGKTWIFLVVMIIIVSIIIITIIVQIYGKVNSTQISDASPSDLLPPDP